QQGDVERALSLWNDSLTLKEQIGDVQGKAATLHNMAGVIAQQGDVERALSLWNDSLTLKEQIGDVQGKAATLANMAWLAGNKQNDPDKAIEFSHQAIESLVSVHDWLNVVTVLDNLSDFVSENESQSCLAQAFWLCLPVSIPVESALNLSVQLLENTGGVEAEHSQLLGAAAVVIVGMRGKDHPKFGELQQYSSNILVACLQAQNIAPDNFQQHIEQQQLLNPEHLYPKLDQLLASWVTEWVFDREQFGQNM
ncbi:MAG: tetratricopeptide repeat protein, partial [Myxococcota bacterium]